MSEEEEARFLRYARRKLLGDARVIERFSEEVRIAFLNGISKTTSRIRLVKYWNICISPVILPELEKFFTKPN